MFSYSKPFLLHAISSVHAGSGSELGIVDLPIQREKHTGFPKIESSSLKGAIRASVYGKNEALENLLFGTRKDNSDNHGASAVSFSDARTLLFPVKSMRHIFAYVTAPSVLQRFNYECKIHGHNIELPVPKENTCSSTKLQVTNNKHVVLEEYAYEIDFDEETAQLGEKLEQILFPEGNDGYLKERLVVLTDNDFTDFVKLSTEINARIQINPKTGVVDKESGALFYEENLPPETVLYGFVFTSDTRQQTDKSLNAEEVLEKLTSGEMFPEVFQLGGNTTIGRGLLSRIFIEEV